MRVKSLVPIPEKRRWWVDASIPFSKLIAKVNWPVRSRYVKEHHYEDYRRVLAPGHILLTYSRLQLSNVFVPGYWGHAAMVMDENVVIEATVSKGVTLTPIKKFMTSKDDVVVVVPNFVRPDQIPAALEFSRKCVGAPYDFRFTHNNPSWYCTEIIYSAIHHATNGNHPLELRERLGQRTIIPEDIARATSKFDVVWDGEINGHAITPISDLDSKR